MPSIPSPGGGGPQEERPFDWTLSVAPYAAAIAMLLAALGCMGAAIWLAPELAVVPAVASAVLAVPAMQSVRALRGPRGFRLTGETLELSKGARRESVRLDQIVDMYPDRVRGVAPFGRPATLMAQGATIALPRWTSAGGRAVIQEVSRRLKRSHLAAHAAVQEASPWPRYANAPRALRELLEDSRARAPGGAALLFSGPVRKHSAVATGARRLFIFVAALLALLAVSIGARPGHDRDVVTGLAVSAVVALVVALLTLARSRPSEGREWLLVHELGMAMVGRQLTGELDWEEVEKITESGSFVTGTASQPGRVFYIRTKDGATIAVRDRYDAPLIFIREACEVLVKRRS